MGLTSSAESGMDLNEPAGTDFLAGASACTNHGKITAGTNKPKQQLNTNRNVRFIPTEIKLKEEWVFTNLEGEGKLFF